MKTIVMGLGNPILGDDGVGWKVAEEVERSLESSPAEEDSPVSVDCCAVGGFSLMERLSGYESAILIDAIPLGLPCGTVLDFELDDLPRYSTGYVGSGHGVSLHDAIAIGRATGADLPHDIRVVGIVTRKAHDFSEVLSPAVAASVQPAAEWVLKLLRTTLCMN